MKFKISTLLLLVAIAALCIGWFVDHFDPSRYEIIGTWRHSSTGEFSSNYNTTLRINRDGTFSKTQCEESKWNTYSGSYATNKDGTITFHVTKREEFDSLASVFMPDATPSAAFDCDTYYQCRCAVDKTGYLLINDSKPRGGFYKGPTIRWEVYVPIAR